MFSALVPRLYLGVQRGKTRQHSSSEVEKIELANSRMKFFNTFSPLSTSMKPFKQAFLNIRYSLAPPRQRSYHRFVSQFLSHRDAAVPLHDFHLSLDTQLCLREDLALVEECVLYAINHGWYQSLISAPAVPDQQLRETRKKDAKALFFIQSALEDDMFPRISAANTAHEAWEILKQEYLGDQKVIKVVGKVLRSLNESFDYLVPAIEESKDLSTYTFDELMSSLLAHETKVRKPCDKVEEEAFQVKGDSFYKDPRHEEPEENGSNDSSSSDSTPLDSPTQNSSNHTSPQNSASSSSIGNSSASSNALSPASNLPFGSSSNGTPLKHFRSLQNIYRT
ncbi:hypothetical protein SASPL_150145 [Salvia splendens]|uniref:Uncharacterized protein n=1 Tax=Salvia splendens TaxID=180675 RepID=A0A8X8W676_SALSN|nr:hypothetical protein SASPL_150145 [Salvia splendens]